MSVRASGAEIGAPIPTPWTLFLRRFVPWQLYRFVRINWKMLRMIGLSHPHRLPPTPPA
ncbi:MAG: hypothetical protein ABMA64_33080 [Myxococcota bacterium]